MRTQKDSYIEMREMVLPQHTNALNTIFGGTVMSWIDIAASMSAAKHSKKSVVTVHVDQIHFISPIKVGEHVLIKSRVVYVGRTSMVISVNVYSDNPYTGELKNTTRAFLTFVALDEHGKPTQVPGLKLESDEEKKVHAEVAKRIKLTKELKQSSKA